MGRKSASGSEIRNEQPGSYFLELRNQFLGIKYLNSLMRIRDRDSSDPRWKKVGSGIRNKHPGSATLARPRCNLLGHVWVRRGLIRVRRSSVDSAPECCTAVPGRFLRPAPLSRKISAVQYPAKKILCKCKSGKNK